MSMWLMSDREKIGGAKMDGGKIDGATRLIKGLRLALGGALVGAAVAGLFSQSLGANPADHLSAFGAVGGFILVAAIKMAHLI